MDERKNRDFSKGPVWNREKDRWFVEIRYPDGARLRKRFRRERDALRIWSSEQTKIEKGTWNVHAPKAITFGAAIELYKAHAKVQVPSYASYTAPALRVWEAGISTDILLSRVSPVIIDAIKQRRSEQVKKCSVDRSLQVLRRFFNWAIEQGLATDNPVRRVKFFRADTKRLRYLTEEEFGRLLDEADKVKRSLFLHEAIELAVSTGLRRGNLLGLRWQWVDWLNRVIRVPRSKIGKPHAVPLNARACAALHRLWGARGESPFVFAHTRGTKAGEAMQDLKKGFHTALENAGIEDFRWHDLRQHAGFRIMPGALVA
jgi:integrase